MTTSQVDGAAVRTPPGYCEFTGWLSGETHYSVQLIGRPSAKAMGQLITALQLYHRFFVEDEALSVASNEAVKDMKSTVGTKHEEG